MPPSSRGKRGRGPVGEEDAAAAWESVRAFKGVVEDGTADAVRLPTVSASGATVEGGLRAQKLAAQAAAASADAKAGSLSKRRLKRLEQIKQEFLRKERAVTSRRLKEAEIAAVGGPQAYSQKNALAIAKKGLAGKSVAEQLAAMASTAQAVLAEPEKTLWRLDLFLDLLGSDAPAGPELRLRDVALLTLSTVLREVTPMHRVAVGEEAGEKKVFKSKKAAGQARVDEQLLAVHRQFLDHVKGRLAGCSGPREALTLAEAAAAVLEAGTGFNTADELLELVMHIASHPLSAAAAHSRPADGDVRPADGEGGGWSDSPLLSAETRCCRCLGELIAQSGDLDIAAKVASLVTKVALATAKGGGSRGGQSGRKAAGGGRSPPLTLSPELLRLIGGINFADKEALADRAAERASYSTGGGRAERKHLSADLSRASVVGDVQRFRAQRDAILRDFVAALLRIFRTPRLFPPHALSCALDGLSRLSASVSLELVLEFYEELRLLIERAALPPADTLAAICAVFRLVRRYGGADAIELDVAAWLPDAYLKLLRSCLPLVAEESSAALDGEGADAASEWLLRELPVFSEGGEGSRALREARLSPVAGATDKLYGRGGDGGRWLRLVPTLAQLMSSVDLAVACLARSAGTEGCFVRVAEALFAVALHCADRAVRVNLVQTVLRLAQAVPACHSLFDSDGIILSSRPFRPATVKMAHGASRYKKSRSKMRWKWKKKRTRRLQRKRRKMRQRSR